MKKFTKILSLLLCLAMIFSFAACTGKTDDSATTTEETVPADTTPINITTLKGPTGMGMAKLISDKNAQYNISIATAATEIAPLIIKGEADIAACPLNLAAAIYKKSGGKVKMIAINTLGVLSILENGESIKSVADLKGKKIGATGQSATPEYILNYILEANGIDPKKDVEITYYTDHAELATLMATGKIDIAMLPEPNVTTVMAKNSSVRKALDLTEEWEKATAAKGEKTSLAQGCLIVRTEFLEAHPNAVKAFLAAYKESVNFVNGNTEKAAQMIADAGIVPNAQIAAKALPSCNIVYMTGDEMIKTAKANFDVLFKADPTSVGGAMPGDDFYYTGKLKSAKSADRGLKNRGGTLLDIYMVHSVARRRVGASAPLACRDARAPLGACAQGQFLARRAAIAAANHRRLRARHSRGVNTRRADRHVARAL